MTPEEFNKICREYDEAPGDFGWDETHPIFKLAQESDNLKAENRKLRLIIDQGLGPEDLQQDSMQSHL